MPWTKKDHYSFDEIANRWRLSIQDLGYFVERGLLGVHTWLSDAVVAVYVPKKTADGETVPVQVDMDSLTGYYVVEPVELRKVFRTEQPVEVRRFLSLDQQKMYATPYNAKGCLLTVGTLEISITERDRFEAEHNLKQRILPANKTGFTSPSAGRPSVMTGIIEQYRQRLARGEIESSLAAEARFLRAWAQKEMKDVRTPAYQTIVNNLRPHYTAQKKNSR
ncbi:MAG: hypothetical protein KGI37_05265 [Alphaproteobacteria bacterium]|nr:hypothetical protein [Alphaproteobacteria bacterium]